MRVTDLTFAITDGRCLDALGPASGPGLRAPAASSALRLELDGGPLERSLEQGVTARINPYLETRHTSCTLVIRSYSLHAAQLIAVGEARERT
jgi:hypothetical protein